MLPSEAPQPNTVELLKSKIKERVDSATIIVDELLLHAEQKETLSSIELLKLPPDEAIEALLDLTDRAVLFAGLVAAAVFSQKEKRARRRFETFLQAASRLKLFFLMLRAFALWTTDNQDYLRTRGERARGIQLHQNQLEALANLPVEPPIYERTAFFKLQQIGLDPSNLDTDWGQAVLLARLPDAIEATHSTQNFLKIAAQRIQVQTHSESKQPIVPVAKISPSIFKTSLRYAFNPESVRKQDPLFFWIVTTVLANRNTTNDAKGNRVAIHDAPIIESGKKHLQLFTEQLQPIATKEVYFNVLLLQKVAEVLHTFYVTTDVTLQSKLAQGGYESKTRYIFSEKEMQLRDKARRLIQELVIWLRTNPENPQSSKESVQILEHLVERRQLLEFSKLFESSSTKTFWQGAFSEALVDLYVIDSTSGQSVDVQSKLELQPAELTDEGNKVDRRYYDSRQDTLYLLQIKSSVDNQTGIYIEQLYRQGEKAESMIPTASVHPAFGLNKISRPTGFGRKFRQEKEKLLQTAESIQQELQTTGKKTKVVGLLVYIPGDLATLKRTLFTPAANS